MNGVAIASVAMALFATACATPEVGELLAPVCEGFDSAPGQDVAFAEVQALLLAAGCVNCHTPGGATPIGLGIGGLDVSTYASLRRGGVQGGADIIVAGDPCASVLVQKVSAAPPFGARMPLNGPPYLSAAQMQLLHDWIAEGARE